MTQQETSLLYTKHTQPIVYKPARLINIFLLLISVCIENLSLLLTVLFLCLNISRYFQVLDVNLEMVQRYESPELSNERECWHITENKMFCAQFLI